MITKQSPLSTVKSTSLKTTASIGEREVAHRDVHRLLRDLCSVPAWLDIEYARYDGNDAVGNDDQHDARDHGPRGRIAHCHCASVCMDPVEASRKADEDRIDHALDDADGELGDGEGRHRFVVVLSVRDPGNGYADECSSGNLYDVRIYAQERQP